MERRAVLERASNTARLDAELVNIARAVGHHGVNNFVETVRQRCHVALTDEYAADLLVRGGHTQC